MMVSTFNAIRLSALAVACTALAGCLGSGGGGGGAAGGGGGGGGGGSATLAEYEAALNSVTGMIPTSDMPVTGTASYAGEVHATLHEGASKVGDLLADVQMEVDFAAASADRTTGVVGGKVDNIRGTVDGEDVAIGGELTVAEADKRGFKSVLEIVTTKGSDIGGVAGGALPGGVTIPDINTGHASINFAGDLTDGEDESIAFNLTLGGNFVGPGGQAIHGAAVGTAIELMGTTKPLSVGGDWYANRK